MVQHEQAYMLLMLVYIAYRRDRYMSWQLSYANCDHQVFAAVSWPAFMASVCIVREASVNQSVDISILTSAGLRVRTSATCNPDLIFTRQGNTVAVVLATDEEELQSPSFTSRLAATCNTSRQPCLLLPSQLTTHPATLTIISHAAAEGKLLVEYAAPGCDLTSAALQLVQALMAPPDVQGLLGCDVEEWRLQQAEALEGWGGLLSALVGGRLGPQEVAAFTAFGSLQGVLSATPEDFAAGLTCCQDTAMRLWQQCNTVEG